jgi:hypothetical protein
MRKRSCGNLAFVDNSTILLFRRTGFHNSEHLLKGLRCFQVRADECARRQFEVEGRSYWMELNLFYFFSSLKLFTECVPGVWEHEIALCGRSTDRTRARTHAHFNASSKLHAHTPCTCNNAPSQPPPLVFRLSHTPTLMHNLTRRAAHFGRDTRARARATTCSVGQPPDARGRRTMKSNMDITMMI